MLIAVISKDIQIWNLKLGLFLINKLLTSMTHQPEI